MVAGGPGTATPGGYRHSSTSTRSSNILRGGRDRIGAGCRPALGYRESLIHNGDRTRPGGSALVGRYRVNGRATSGPGSHGGSEPTNITVGGPNAAAPGRNGHGSDSSGRIIRLLGRVNGIGACPSPGLGYGDGGLPEDPQGARPGSSGVGTHDKRHDSVSSSGVTINNLDPIIVAGYGPGAAASSVYGDTPFPTRSRERNRGRLAEGEGT